MKKFLLDLIVTSIESLSDRHFLLKLTHAEPLPAALPGQFVEVRVDGSPSTFLRRPISINNIDRARNELWLLVAAVGSGTRRLSQLHVGDTLNCLLPLGNSFSLPRAGERKLLVGGGVGMAPMYFLGKSMCDHGFRPSFLLGARTASDVLLIDEFRELGDVYVTTEDGSLGEQGFVTNHSVLAGAENPPQVGRDALSDALPLSAEADGELPGKPAKVPLTAFDSIATCGPKPMMMAVARYAKAHGLRCEVSLENMMACGLGACLCCVEKTTTGNRCVCKDGPVFNIDELLWQI